jgi:hypothetical protein
MANRATPSEALAWCSSRTCRRSIGRERPGRGLLTNEFGARTGCAVLGLEKKLNNFILQAAR